LTLKNKILIENSTSESANKMNSLIQSKSQQRNNRQKYQKNRKLRRLSSSATKRPYQKLNSHNTKSKSICSLMTQMVTTPTRMKNIFQSKNINKFSLANLLEPSPPEANMNESIVSSVGDASIEFNESSNEESEEKENLKRYSIEKLRDYCQSQRWQVQSQQSHIPSKQQPNRQQKKERFLKLTTNLKNLFAAYFLILIKSNFFNYLLHKKACYSILLICLVYSLILIISFTFTY
jgi:hypothetical protein